MKTFGSGIVGYMAGLIFAGVTTLIIGLNEHRFLPDLSIAERNEIMFPIMIPAIVGIVLLFTIVGAVIGIKRERKRSSKVAGIIAIILAIAASVFMAWGFISIIGAIFSIALSALIGVIIVVWILYHLIFSIRLV